MLHCIVVVFAVISEVLAQNHHHGQATPAPYPYGARPLPQYYPPPQPNYAPPPQPYYPPPQQPYYAPPQEPNYYPPYYPPPSQQQHGENDAQARMEVLSKLRKTTSEVSATKQRIQGLQQKFSDHRVTASDIPDILSTSAQGVLELLQQVTSTISSLEKQFSMNDIIDGLIGGEKQLSDLAVTIFKDPVAAMPKMLQIVSNLEGTLGSALRKVSDALSDSTGSGNTTEGHKPYVDSTSSANGFESFASSTESKPDAPTSTQGPSSDNLDDGLADPSP